MDCWTVELNWTIGLAVARDVNKDSNLKAWTKDSSLSSMTTKAKDNIAGYSY